MEPDLPMARGDWSVPPSVGPTGGPAESTRRWIHALLEALPHASLVAEASGQWLAWNRAATELLGAGVSNLAGAGPDGLTALLDAIAETPGAAAAVIASAREIGGAAEPTDAASRSRRTLPLATPLARCVEPRCRSLVVDGHRIGTLWELPEVAPAGASIADGGGRAALEELTRELRAAQARLQQSEKLASLGLLVAGIAHEINTPMGAVASMHDTLVRAVDRLRTVLATEISRDPACEPKVVSLLRYIDDANRVIADGAGRVSCLVKRLKTFARVDDADPVEADVNEALEDTLLLLRHELEPRIQVRRELGPLPRILGYPARLSQVFVNLLVNAAQAIEGEGKIVVRTRADAERVVVTIEDSGCGIREEHLDRIFEPGFTTKQVGVGTGLGLAISRQIVDEHGGTIEVSSRPGEGARFTVSLPIHPVTRPGAIASSNPGGCCGSSTA
jgi:signal transduction histidine kinase